MSRRQGLGNPHLRGEGQPRPPRLTSRDGVSEIASGCGYLSMVILAIPLILILPIAYMLGVDYIAGLMAHSAMGALEEPVVLILVGVAMIGLAAWISYRVYRRRSTPEVTPLAVLYCGVIVVVLISLGLIAVVSAIVRSDTSGF